MSEEYPLSTSERRRCLQKVTQTTAPDKMRMCDVLVTMCGGDRRSAGIPSSTISFARVCGMLWKMKGLGLIKIQNPVLVPVVQSKPTPPSDSPEELLPASRIRAVPSFASAWPRGETAPF